MSTLTGLATSPAYGLARRRVAGQLVCGLVVEGLVPHEWDGGDLVVPSARRATASLRVPAKRRALGRITAHGEIRSTGDQDGVGPVTVLEEVRGHLEGTDPGRVARFADELDRTVVAHAAAVAGGADPADGHRYHPSFRSRLGFDLEDGRRYTPEADRPIRPLWVGLDPGVATVSGGLDPADLVAATHGDRGGDGLPGLPTGMIALPVHPWQWTHRVATRLAPLLATGDAVEVGPAPHRYRATSSIRTLADLDEPRAPSLKLSLGIVNTSTVRTLAPHTVRNAPRISAWLERAVRRALPADRRPRLLREFAGVSADGGTAPPGLGPQLGAIWRESPASAVGPRERLLTLAACASPDRLRAVVGEIEPGRWTRQLLETVLVPTIQVLVTEGIALEAHGQNTAVVLRDGRPVRLVLQDFHDGIRFCPAALARPDDAPTLAPTPDSHANPNSFLEADSPEEVRDFLLDCLLFVNLAEIAATLDDHLGLAERRFWELARGVVADLRAARPDLAERHRLFDVTAPTIRVEKLVARRLLPDDRVRTHEVDNPLADAS